MASDPCSFEDMNVRKFIDAACRISKNIFSAILPIMLVVFILGSAAHQALAGQKGGANDAQKDKVQMSRIEFVTRLKDPGEKIAISSDGQIFLLLREAEDIRKIYTLKKDGSLEAFPDAAWYGEPAKDGDPPYRLTQRFFAPKAIRATLKNSVMVLDGGDEHHSARITDFDITTHAILRSFYIPAENLASNSLLSDMGYDWEKAQAYILDSGRPGDISDRENRGGTGDNSLPPKSADAAQNNTPAIIFYNLKDGTMMRRPLLPPASQPHTDGAAIILDVLNDNLYVAVGQGAVLQYAEISEVSDVTLTHDAVSKNIKMLGTQEAGGGMAVDAKGNVYIGRAAQHEIGVINSHGDYAPYITDPRIGRIDSMAYAPNGYIYALMRSESEILDPKNKNLPLPTQNASDGKNAVTSGYFVIRFRPLWPGSIGG